jgi:type I restriction enzyme S subunit
MRETLVKTGEFRDSSLGKIPKDWDVVTVESIAADKPHAVVDGPFGSNLKTEHYREYGIPVIQSGFVTSGVFLAESYVYVDRALFQAQKRSAVEPGDIVMAKIGAQCGTSAILPANHPVGILAGNSLKISTNPDKCRAAYLLRILHYYYHTGQIDLIKTETAQPAISLKNLRALRIPLPLCVKEQDAITSILDALDEAIAHTSSLITKLKQMKAGLLHDLLTRGLDENGELRDAIAHPEQFKDSPLGRIPKDWEVRTMEEITTKIVDGVHKTPVYVESGIPFLTVENLTAGIGISLKNVRYVTPSAHAEFFKRADPRPGDVLVSKDGTLGIARIVTDDLPEFSIFVSVAQLRPNEALVLPSFICTFFETGEYERQLGHRSAGTGLKHIHLEHFRAFQLAVPPIAEQHRISKVLNSHDIRIRKEEAYRDKLKFQKQGLMHDLLTGKVRVKNA